VQIVRGLWSLSFSLLHHQVLVNKFTVIACKVHRYALGALNSLTYKVLFCYILRKRFLKRGLVMKKCLKITFISSKIEGFLNDFVQKNARVLHLEGTVQFIEPNEVSIIACGSKENIDTFLDIIHQGFGPHIPENVSVEPFLKEKDYRGIFRILE
jgi:acylphosphatase